VWRSVRDQTATPREESQYTTDPTLRPDEVVGLDCGRWDLEITFQEGRTGLGRESTCGWGRGIVPRAAPGLFGMYPGVALLYHLLPEGKQGEAFQWPGKRGVTLSDALAAVHRWTWAESVWEQADRQGEVAKLQLELRGVAAHRPRAHAMTAPKTASAVLSRKRRSRCRLPGESSGVSRRVKGSGRRATWSLPFWVRVLTSSAGLSPPGRRAVS
jgi:hypothetical protein